uniref:L-type lectin-like domain-containing protein n=1 Tax=Plectus sambesii TaxID=2011161 RepID=A0A914V4I8_9BILA
VWSDIRGQGVWEKCFSVGGVRLPTGYYIGMSAATGDLHDAHEVVSVRLFEQEYARAEKEGEVEHHLIEPMSEFSAAPRDHVTDPKPSKLGWFGTIVLVIVAIVVIAGALGFGLVFLQKRQEMGRKRFY